MASGHPATKVATMKMYIPEIIPQSIDRVSLSEPYYFWDNTASTQHVLT